MGVNYTAVLAIGKEFENEREAEEFLREVGLMTDEDESIDSWLPGNLVGQGLDLYSGYGYYIGYNLRPTNPDKFSKDFESAIAAWEKLFKGKAEAEIIHTVRIH